jgi:hypothetical protein
MLWIGLATCILLALLQVDVSSLSTGAPQRASTQSLGDLVALLK